MGSATAFTLYYLAKHQEIQERVVKEINTVILQPESVNIDNLNSLKYLEQCIKETMRLYPSIPLIARKLSEDVKLGRYTFYLIYFIIIIEFEYINNYCRL